MQLLAQVEENKSLQWMIKGNQHKYKVDIQRYQVEKNCWWTNHIHVEKQWNLQLTPWSKSLYSYHTWYVCYEH